MKRVVVEGRGGPEVLQVREGKTPHLLPGCVRIEMAAAGIAYGDLLRRRGILAPPWSFTPGYDGVGVVRDVGAFVSKDWIGRRVGFLMPFTGMGAQAQLVCVPAFHLALLPNQLSWQESGALGVNYVSAWQLLTRVAELSTPSTILMHGGAGGLGSAVLDVARALGHQVLATASKAKHWVIERYGATPIDYRHTEFVEEVAQLAPGGVDLVIDPIGGEHLSRSLRCARSSGLVVSVGISGVADMGLGRALLSSAAQVRRARKGKVSVVGYGVHVSRGCGRRQSADDLKRMLDWRAEGSLLGPACETLALEDIVEAHRRLEEGRVVGKLLVTTGGDA